VINNYKKISVVVPSFNQSDFIERTILSIINQGYPNLELIIIDGKSSDSTIEILKRYDAHISKWVSEKDNGQSDAVNKGLKMATGEIIGWINSDDVYLNNCLFQANHYFKNNPDVGIVFANYYYIDTNDYILSRRKEIKFDFNTYIWTRDCYHANCSGFFSNDTFLKIGYLDTKLHYSMDYEFYIRAYSKGIIIDHKNEIWSGYRLHESSKSVASNEKQVKDTELILSKLGFHRTSKIRNLVYYSFYTILRLLKKLFMGSYFPIKKYQIKIKGIKLL